MEADDGLGPLLLDELHRLMKTDDLPVLGAARRMELQLLATETYRAPAGSRASMLNGLIGRVVDHEMQTCGDRLEALVIAAAEVIVVLREWEWLDLQDMQAQGAS